MRRKLYKLYNALYRHYGPQKWWPARTKFEVIVGAILTQNTSWKNVEKAIRSLAGAKLLNPRSMEKSGKKRIASLIRPSGYYNIKAERLKNFIDFLFSKYDGSLRKMFSRDMQTLRAELLEVKGLGPETADSILLYAGEKPVFVVDAYTKRILSRHKVISIMDTYEKVQRLFMENIRPDARIFNEYHALLVRLAKDACNKKPKCSKCPARSAL
ncbi:MAG: endonuclease III domain-containing protein [Candidatus Omnitrophota bacterium]